MTLKRLSNLCTDLSIDGERIAPGDEYQGGKEPGPDHVEKDV